ncbi:MAG: hypothetical protein ABI353_06900 [Isosphaeraceae bacterium]
MMRMAIGYGLVMATVMTATARAQDKDKGTYQDDKRFGTYEFVSGRNADGEFSKGQLSGTVKVTKDMVYRYDKDGKETHAIAYKVKGDKEPYKIDLEIKRSIVAKVIGRTAKGLGKNDGDVATLIYSYAEEGDYPDDFKPDAQQNLFVLKRTGD